MKTGNREIRESGDQETGLPASQIPDSPIPDSLIPITLCIVFLALALRLHQLNADSLWEDEIFTATQSPLPAAELLRWTAGDIHPPGYYLLVGGWANAWGWAHQPPSALTDWLWRFPSVLAGTLAVAVTYRLGADLLGRRVGLAGALLLAVSPAAVQYSQEARMHELFLLGAVLSTWTLTRALARPARRRWWLAYALTTALNLYTVYLAFVVLVAQVAWVAISYRRSAVCRQSSVISYQLSAISYQLTAVLLAFALYLPWWPTLLGIVARRLAADHAEAGVGSPLVFGIKAIDSLGPGAGWTAWLFLGLWAVGVVSIARQRPPLAVFGGLWLLLPLALPFVFRDPRALHVRYAFLLPVYLLFVAQGVLAAGRWGMTNLKYLSFDICYLIFVSGLVLVSVLYLPAYYRQSKPDWRGVGTYLAARTRPGDVIVTDPLFDVGRYLDYYYDGPAELVTPALLVTNLSDRVVSMRASNGRVWAVTRFHPKPVAAVQPVEFFGLTVSEPVVAIYEPDVLTAAMIDLMQQAVAAAPGWAAEMSAGGVMDPDPLVAQAAAYLFLGDVYRAAGRLPEAVAAYQAMVADYPTAAGYVVLAKAYEAAGRPEQATLTYQQAVALNPTWYGARADAAASLAAAGRWAEAAAAYQSIVNGELH